ncbi:hypothetical protein TNCV_2876321 [Trichonephila clavipes]|nr:hypothetical protein TNCV_2876321 [Trichonephila clavipes]
MEVKRPAIEDFIHGEKCRLRSMAIVHRAAEVSAILEVREHTDPRRRGSDARIIQFASTGGGRPQKKVDS